MPLSGLVILAVDDNEAHSYALVRLLRERGKCIVLSAYSGEEALALTESCTPDAILLDVNLPDLKGWEVCRRMRQLLHLKSVPIIFLTAEFHGPEAKDLAKNVGASNLLFHPVEPAQLFAVIQGEIAKAANKDRDLAP